MLKNTATTVGKYKYVNVVAEENADFVNPMPPDCLLTFDRYSSTTIKQSVKMAVLDRSRGRRVCGFQCLDIQSGDSVSLNDKLLNPGTDLAPMRLLLHYH